MLTVGIHENLVVNKAAKNDKGSLVVSVKQVSEVNALDALNGSTASTSFEQAEQDFLIYPPQVENGKGDIDDPKNIMKKIGEVKDPLVHILLQYTTSSNLKWNIFAGTPIKVVEDIPLHVTNPATLTKIYNNIVDQFLAQVSPFLGPDGKKFRMIFPRQSKAKHFPSLRKRFLDQQPFMEPMTIPQEASKLRFSKYELDNGLNVPDPVSGEQRVSKREAEAADALLR